MTNTTIPWSVKSTVSILASITLSSRRRGQSSGPLQNFVCNSLSRQTQNSGTAYVFLQTQSKIDAITEFNVVDIFLADTAGEQMRDGPEADIS